MVALGAGVGSGLRYLVALRLDAAMPWGTLAVNLIGSFLLGLLSALSLSADLSALTMIGFCGGFTTYSAFAGRTVELGWRAGATYAVLTTVGGVLASFLGFAVGQA